MADQKANQHTSLAIADIVANHIFRTSKEDGSGNNKITLPEYKKYTTRNRVAYNSGAVPDASVFGDGALVAFSSGVTPLPTFWSGALEARTVLLRTFYDAAADTIRYTTQGTALFFFSTTNEYIQADVDFDPSTNTIRGSLTEEYYVTQVGENSPSLTRLKSDFPDALIGTPGYVGVGTYDFIITTDYFNETFDMELPHGYTTGAASYVATWEKTTIDNKIKIYTGDMANFYALGDGFLNGRIRITFPLI